MIGARSIRLSSQSRNEREYEILRRVKKEQDSINIDRNIRLYPAEIESIAQIIKEEGQDPEELFKLLRFESESFGVRPDEVYHGELSDDKEWVYYFDLDEVEQLRDLICTAFKYGKKSDSEIPGSRPESTLESLNELCELLTLSSEIEIPPKLASK